MSPAPEQKRDPAQSAMRLARLRELPGSIGPFKLLRQIGEGGMGIVILAQQENPTRTVALKVIHTHVLSPRTLYRFKQEAETLARLQHPGVAQIYQIGTYETPQGDLPYIAMEYVEGERLDHWNQKRSPSLKERLELAALITEAVEHAHLKGVIHRDLKPGNILVTAEARPKIVDFGVARLNDDDTRTTTLRTDLGSLMGTLTYMSPEQASGDPDAVDRRSDVYSLGVVFYELVTGKLPYAIERAPLPEAVRVIREEEPTKLSTHLRTLRGDVETIVLKALEKDPARRYASAQELGDDIRRYLADQPIHARPPSALYQFSKFARRNKVLVGGAAAVALSLAAGTAVSTRLYLKERDANQREREAREQAQVDERHAEATAEFLISIFGGMDPAVALGADTELLRRLLGNARGRLALELADQPLVQARLRATLGRSYMALNLFDEAEVELKAAQQLLVKQFGPDDRRSIEVETSLAALLQRRGELEEAERAKSAALDRQERVLGAEAPDSLAARSALADNLMRQGRLREAETILRETLAEQERVLDADDPEIGDTRIALAQTLNYVGEYDEAQRLLEPLILARTERMGPDHPESIAALGTLGSTFSGMGRLEEAEAILRDVLERTQRVFGADNQQSYAVMNNLAHALNKRGKAAEAEEMMRAVLAGRIALLGSANVETYNARVNLIEFLWKQRRFEDVEALLGPTLDGAVRDLGPESKETLRAHGYMALLLNIRHKSKEALPHLEAVAKNSRAVRSSDDTELALDLYNWAAGLQNAGEWDASEPVLREVVGLFEQHPALVEEDYAPAAFNALAKVHERRGEYAQADELFERALEQRRVRYGADGDHPEIALSLGDWSEHLLKRGETERAKLMLEELIEMRERSLPSGDWQIASAWALYGRCLLMEKQYADAEDFLVRACETMVQSRVALPGAARYTRESICELYAEWDAAEPGQGIAARAERWQAKFAAEN
jgi:tetratricopeptide (TPR) repeat protein/predicted Ser/Thr protein kinase